MQRSDRAETAGEVQDGGEKPRVDQPVHTPLELAILGVLSQSGPCTAYAVRRQFQRSPSSKWSGSAGAVYPALRRLESAGLVSSAAVAGSARKARDYRLGPLGAEALKGWLRSPVSDEEAAPGYDPLRLRVFFFDELAPAERLRVVGDMIAALERSGEAIGDYERESEVSFLTRWAQQGARRVWRARLEWLYDLRDALAAMADEISA